MKSCPSCRSPKEGPISIASVASVWNNCSRCGWIWRKSLLETVLGHAGDRIDQLRGTLKSSFTHDQPASLPAGAAAIAASAPVPVVPVPAVGSDDFDDLDDLRVFGFGRGLVDSDKIAASVEDELASWGGDAPAQGVRAQGSADPGKTVTPVEDALALWGGEARQDFQADEIDQLDAGLCDGSSLRSSTDQKIRTITPIIDVWRPSAPIQAAAAVHADTVAPPAHLSPPVQASLVQPPAPVETAPPPPVQDHQRLTASVDRTLQNVDDLCDVFARLQQQLAGLERSCEALIGTAA